MRVCCLALTACLLCSPVQAQDKTKNDQKIIGTWAVTKSEEAATGTTLEFTKEGKLKLTLTVGGKPISLEGTYKVEGDSIKVSLKGPDGKEKAETVKIKELTDKKLVTVDDRGKIDEFAKKK